MGWLFGKSSDRQEKKRLRALEMQRRKEIKIANKRATKRRAATQTNAFRDRLMKRTAPSGRQSLFSERKREKGENFFKRARRRRAEISSARRDRISHHKAQRARVRENRISARNHRRELRVATRQRLRKDRSEKMEDFKYKAALFLATTPKNRK